MVYSLHCVLRYIKKETRLISTLHFILIMDTKHSWSCVEVAILWPHLAIEDQNKYPLLWFQGDMGRSKLIHCGRVTRICVGKLTNIGSDNGLAPGRRQAIIRTNAGILLIGPWGTNFSEILIEIEIFSFNKMHLKMSSENRHLFYLGINMLIFTTWYKYIHLHYSPGVSHGVPNHRQLDCLCNS